MKNNKVFSLSNILSGLLFMIFLISFAAVFTLNFRPLYYNDIKKLNIAETSGYSEEEIRQNYDALISYNSLFYTGELNFPTLPMSENGRIHFAEVKVIFNAVQIIMLASFLGCISAAIVKTRKKQHGFWLTGAVLSIAVPLILGALIALNWDKFFVMFHKIFFNNDYWIFNPATDPVINILPDTFFMHCAIMIISLVLIGSMLLLIPYFTAKHKKHVKINQS